MHNSSNSVLSAWQHRVSVCYVTRVYTQRSLKCISRARCNVERSCAYRFDVVTCGSCPWWQDATYRPVYSESETEKIELLIKLYRTFCRSLFVIMNISNHIGACCRTMMHWRAAEEVSLRTAFITLLLCEMSYWASLHSSQSQFVFREQKHFCTT